MRFLFLLCLAGVALCKAADYRPDRDGAETVVGLVVADPDGKPISDAEVMFRVFTTLDRCYRATARRTRLPRCALGEVRGNAKVDVWRRDESDGLEAGLESSAAHLRGYAAGTAAGRERTAPIRCVSGRLVCALWEGARSRFWDYLPREDECRRPVPSRRDARGAALR